MRCNETLVIQYKMFIDWIKVISISVASNIYHFFMLEAFKILPFSYFEICNKLL